MALVVRLDGRRKPAENPVSAVGLGATRPLGHLQLGHLRVGIVQSVTLVILVNYDRTG